MLFQETRTFLKSLGLPASDSKDFPTSELRFSDGSQFRIEVPTVNSASGLRALLERAEELGITINRVTETYGMFRHCAAEISDFVSLCEQFGVELLMSVGPRATYDTGASVQSEHGAFVGYRLRGCEQLVRAVEDVKRGIELGVRGFVIYDEGLLWVLSEMRGAGEIPGEVVLKVSAHCGHGNPASMKILERLGADSINPIRDLSLASLASMRKAIAIPLDCHTDNPPSSGGFVRFYEAPEFVRVLSPVSLKVGNSVLSAHGQRMTATDAVLMAEQVSIALEMIDRYYPAAVQSRCRNKLVPLRAVDSRVVSNV